MTTKIGFDHLRETWTDEGSIAVGLHGSKLLIHAFHASGLVAKTSSGAQETVPLISVVVCRRRRSDVATEASLGDVVVVVLLATCTCVIYIISVDSLVASTRESRRVSPGIFGDHPESLHATGNTPSIIACTP